MSSPLFWIGIRESEISACRRLFAGSITIFGSGKNGNHAFDQHAGLRYNYNCDNDQWNQFVEQEIHHICIENPDALFLLYYPDECSFYGEELRHRLVCQNDEQLIGLLEDKQRTRSWLSGTVPILPYLIRMGSDLTYESMCQAFPGHYAFVLQEGYSCGGSGTHYVASCQDCKEYLDEDKHYSVSPYLINSISPNVHIVVYENDILVLPPSIQLFSADDDRFSYRGADFVMYRHLPADTRKKVHDYALIIGERLRYAGYRGICGIDFLCDKQEVYLMEINARFQSSSFLINRAMREQGSECSLQELHMDAFTTPSCPFAGLHFDVNYSFWGYSYHPWLENQLRYIHNLHRSIGDGEAECVDDCLDWNMRLENNTYLFKSIFKGNIAGLSPDFSCRLHSNICELSFQNQIGEWNHENAIKWKIMLLNHGVRIDQKVLDITVQSGGINFEEFSAIDMIINDEIYVNIPYCFNRSQMSPFEIVLDADRAFRLCFTGKFIANVKLRYVDKLAKKVTSSGIPYSDIAYMSNDRLRVYHRPGCFFKENGCGCGFCDIEAEVRHFTFEDIKEVIMAYRNISDIRHYLIGGGSDSPSSDFRNIVELAQYIKDVSNKPIYLMSLPPRNKGVLPRLKKAGITEVAFNLEVFDRKLAGCFMPGKGKIPLSVYESAFDEAVGLWGNTGNVRTIFIVGLESEKSLLEGIEYVCRKGISPILSLFKPIEGTPLSYLITPSDQEIYDIYLETLELCNKYHVPLGPVCHYCEDNTIKISFI